MKNTKRYITGLLISCLLLVLSACLKAVPPSPNPDVSYRIIVVDEGNNPVSDVLVTICQDKEGGICYMPVRTDENGMAVFYKEAIPVQDNLKVRVMSGGGVDLPMADGNSGYILIPNGTTEMTLTVLIMPQ